MPATGTYRNRKARGVCPRCEGQPAADFVYCLTCRLAWQARHREKVDAQREAPGPNLVARGGHWHPVRVDS